ncbi:MAG: zinc ribbon domain-containing protein [Proteobacteria bacterium]|nr:zinc ribbon domain-containing protein [Pseudomonadota bacterium]
MPIFEFKCVKCGHQFETITSSREDGSTLCCPVCGAPKPEKLLSLFSSSGSQTSGGGCMPSSGFS